MSESLNSEHFDRITMPSAKTDQQIEALLQAAQQEDFYERLNLKRDASPADISSAYRKLAIKTHPDKVQGHAREEELLDAFKRFSEAHETLSDSEKRAAYDRPLSSASFPQRSRHNSDNYRSYDPRWTSSNNAQRAAITAAEQVQILFNVGRFFEGTALASEKGIPEQYLFEVSVQSMSTLLSNDQFFPKFQELLQAVPFAERLTQHSELRSQAQERMKRCVANDFYEHALNIGSYFTLPKNELFQAAAQRLQSLPRGIAGLRNYESLLSVLGTLKKEFLQTHGVKDYAEQLVDDLLENQCFHRAGQIGRDYGTSFTPKITKAASSCVCELLDRPDFPLRAIDEIVRDADRLKLPLREDAAVREAALRCARNAKERDEFPVYEYVREAFALEIPQFAAPEPAAMCEWLHSLADSPVQCELLGKVAFPSDYFLNPTVRTAAIEAYVELVERESGGTQDIPIYRPPNLLRPKPADLLQAAAGLQAEELEEPILVRLLTLLEDTSIKPDKSWANSLSALSQRLSNDIVRSEPVRLSANDAYQRIAERANNTVKKQVKELFGLNLLFRTRAKFL